MMLTSAVYKRVYGFVEGFVNFRILVNCAIVDKFFLK